MTLFLRVLLSLLLPAITLVWIPSLLRQRGMPLFWIGVPLIGIGAAILAACIFGFAATGRGTLAPIDPPRRLVTSGLYRYVRNPMYVGGLLVLLGKAIAFRSAPLLVYALGWWVAAHLFIVLYEEPHLAGVFGREYEEYRRAVPRWIPKAA